MNEPENSLPANDPLPRHDTPPEPESLTSEKPPIRVSQEEFVDDMAQPSKDKSEYEAEQAADPAASGKGGT